MRLRWGEKTKRIPTYTEELELDAYFIDGETIEPTSTQGVSPRVKDIVIPLLVAIIAAVATLLATDNLNVYNTPSNVVSIIFGPIPTEVPASLVPTTPVDPTPQTIVDTFTTPTLPMPSPTAVSATETPTLTSTSPADVPWTITVTTAAGTTAYVRAGPTLNSEARNAVSSGQIFQVLSMTASEGWYEISMGAGYLPGWISRNVVQANGYCANVPKAADEPVPLVPDTSATQQPTVSQSVAPVGQEPSGNTDAGGQAQSPNQPTQPTQVTQPTSIPVVPTDIPAPTEATSERWSGNLNMDAYCQSAGYDHAEKNWDNMSWNCVSADQSSSSGADVGSACRAQAGDSYPNAVLESSSSPSPHDWACYS